MYVVVVTHAKIAALNDLMAIILPMFPNDRFAIVGSEDKGYQLRVLGLGDEKAPRKIAEPFLKKWKPSAELLLEVTKLEVVRPWELQPGVAQMKKDDAEYFANNPRRETAPVMPLAIKRKRGRPPKIKVYETLDEAISVE